MFFFLIIIKKKIKKDLGKSKAPTIDVDNNID